MAMKIMSTLVGRKRKLGKNGGWPTEEFLRRMRPTYKRASFGTSSGEEIWQMVLRASADFLLPWRAKREGHCLPPSNSTRCWTLL